MADETGGASVIEPSALEAADRVIGESRAVKAARLAGRIGGRVLGAVFLAAGLLKAIAPAAFAQEIAGYGLVTNPVATALIAYAIVIFECGLGAALLANLKPRITLVVAFAVLLAFLVLLGWAWATNATENCGCFGPWKRSPAAGFFEDLVLLAVAGWAWWGQRGAPAATNAVKLGIAGLAVAAGIMVPAVAGMSGTVEPGSAGAVGSTIFKTMEVKDLPSSLATGEHVVFLMSTECPHCKDSVPAVNALAADTRLPGTVAIAMNDRVERGLFREDYKAQFAIGEISQADLIGLLKKQFPRVFLVRDGVIVAAWDETVPSAEEVLSAGQR